MLKEICFQNFRVLKNATLPLSRVTILAGANGSGKSTVLQALRILSGARVKYEDVVSVDCRESKTPVEIRFVWDKPDKKKEMFFGWDKEKGAFGGSDHGITQDMNDFAARVRVFSLMSGAIAAPVQITPNVLLDPNGGGLAGVLDNLDDNWRDRFELLNAGLPKWIPEFDRIGFDQETGAKVFKLRRKLDGLFIRAVDLSEGSLFAITLLTLAHLPNPPSLVGLEHPDAGIHPRLLRKVQDAIYRLAYPENYGEKRLPTQVIATTHSPYFLDLFKEHPEEIVFANKTDEGVVFQRLSDRPHVADILPDGPLGDLWYSGLLGGVPSQP